MTENKSETLSRAADIISANSDVLEEFFVGCESGEYYDGSCYQLYLDTDDDSLSISQQISSNDWMQRDDGSIIKVYSVSGYCDTPEDELYTDGCDINDYGYGDWLKQIEVMIVDSLEQQE